MTAGLKVGIVFAITILLAGICFQLDLKFVGAAFSTMFCLEFILLPWMVEAFGGKWSL